MRRRQHRRVVLVCFLLLMSPLLEPSYSFSAAKLPRRGLDRHKEQHFLNVVHFSSSLASRRRPFLSRLAETKTNNDGSEETKQPKISDKTLGILVLLTVPLSWGTYTPVVKYLYEIQPPVPGFVFSASYYMLAAVTTTVLALLSREPKDAKNAMNDNSQTSYWPIQGGLELGSYLFVANCLQVVGLQTVPSDRAGFLVQLTTVMVPFVEAVLAGNLLAVPIKTWYACILAFLGLFVMGLDGKAMLLDNPMATFATTFSSFTHGDLLTCSTGDLLIVGAAGFYSLHVVRLGGFARETTPIRLAATKATTEAIFSVGLVGFLMFLASSISASDGLMGFAVSTGSEISSFFSTFFAGVVSGIVPKSALFSALGATLWTGWITCAYTIYAQSFGQSRVSPTNANLIYTFQPIFTAFFAFLLLGETMGPAGFFGGGLIGLAVYIVATSYSDVESNNLILGSSSTDENPLIQEEGFQKKESKSSTSRNESALAETRVNR